MCSHVLFFQGYPLLVNGCAHQYFTKRVDFRSYVQTIMLTMVLVLKKFMVPLAFLLAISFFVGATLAPAVMAGQAQVEQCCDKENVPEVPVEDGECFDCNCCLTCQFVINTKTEQTELLASTTLAYSWLVSQLVPSEFTRSIDYPPEHA